MEGNKLIRKIGKCALFVLFFVRAYAGFCGDFEFSAQVDRNQIAVDDSVALKISIRSEGGGVEGRPAFSAPDFDLVNDFSSNFVESYYENGRFGMRNTLQLTKVLRPKRVGTLKITGIHASIGGKVYTAPDIVIQVAQSGRGTPPPSGYGGAGVGLRGAGKRSPGNSFLVRAEVDKSSVYKGEQVIVSYYLYERVRLFNIQVDKFPDLNGFLREDLEMPIVGQRLTAEQVILDGVSYQRFLLAKYAVYPLEIGKLKIDPIALKFNYYAGNSAAESDDDPFLNFFQQLTPRAGDARSEPLSVSVQQLPEERRPASFSGGVGDFSVKSAVDRTEVRANEAITLTVHVEGKGNLASIEDPKAKWPDSIELYDTKGRTKAGTSANGGVGEKVFEYLLIPRTPGKFSLPSLEFSFFDPTKKTYVAHKTEPIQISVLEAAPGTSTGPLVRPKSKKVADNEQASTETLNYLKPPGEKIKEGFEGLPIWRWLYWGSVLCFCIFVLIVVMDRIRTGMDKSKSSKEFRDLARSKSWESLRLNAKEAKKDAPWQDVVATYERLMGTVFDSIDKVYKIGSRSLPRSELEQILVGERGLSSEIWEKVSRLLEYGEQVRFAGSGTGTFEASARRDLEKWVNEGEKFAKTFDRKSSV